MSECIGLEVGARVEIVASDITCSFVGRRGEVERLTKPYWLARVVLDGSPTPITFWVEELRVLPAQVEEMHAERRGAKA